MNISSILKQGQGRRMPPYIFDWFNFDGQWWLLLAKHRLPQAPTITQVFSLFVGHSLSFTPFFWKMIKMLNNQNISFHKERFFLALFLPKLNNSGQSLISALYYGRDLIKSAIIVSVGRSGILGVVRVFGWTPHFTFYEIWQIDTRERIARRRRRKNHHFAKPCRPRCRPRRR